MKDAATQPTLDYVTRLAVTRINQYILVLTLLDGDLRVKRVQFTTQRINELTVARTVTKMSFGSSRLFGGLGQYRRS